MKTNFFFALSPRLCAFAFVFIFITTALAQNEDDRLRLLSADVARSLEQNGQVIRQLEGNVKFQQGAMRMSCQRAIQYVDAGRTEFLGKVEVNDEDRTLLAERVIYNEKTKVQEAFQNVRVRRGPNSLRAEKVTYFRESRRAIAENKVELYNRERRIRVNGGRADYFRETEYARVIDHPVLVELDSLGVEIMRVTGDTMEVFDGGTRAKVKGNVKITRNKTRAECGEAEYFSDDERLELRLAPVAWQAQDEIRGRLISLFFVDEKLMRAHVADQANVVSKVDTLATDDRVNTLSGGEITIFFEHDRVKQMLVERTATSFYHVIEDGRNKGRNRAQGDRITLHFDENQISRVLVESRPGLSSGKFVPPNMPFDAAADSAGARRTE